MSGNYLRHGMDRAFKKAKLLRTLNLLSGLVIVILPFAMSFFITVEVTILILFFARGLQFVLNLACRSWISIGRRLHQQNLFFDGLGEKAMPGTVQEIVRDFGEPILASSPYFASSDPAGPMRLIANTAESAFFTATYARFYKWVVLVPIIFLISYMAYVLFRGSNDVQGEEGLKLILALSGFFLFGDVSNRFLEVQAMEGKSDQICKEGLKLMSEQDSNMDVKTAKDYSFKYILSLGTAIPLPNWIHRLKNKSTTDAWLVGLKLK